MSDRKKAVAGWAEEYACGCYSKPVKRKKDLLGYCAKHGDSRRNLYREAHGQIWHAKREAPSR